VSRVTLWLAHSALVLGLVIVIVWPTLATIIEASQAVPRLESVLRKANWTTAADMIASWRPATLSTGGSAIDPVASQATVRDSGDLDRKLRLAFETLRLVATTEAIALPTGIVLAILLFRTDLWGRRVFLAVLTLSAFVPLPLHATAWLGAFGNVGRAQVFGIQPILVGHTGAALVHAIAALPWVVFIVGIGLTAVEPELEELALLECGPIAVLWRVTVRRSVAAIAAAGLAVALLTAGDMTVTDLLRIRTYAEEAYVQYVLGRGPADAALVALPPLLLFGLLIMLLGRSLDRFDPARIASSFTRSRPFKLGRWRVTCGLFLFFLIGAIVAIPIYGLVWRAGRVGGRATMGRPPVWSWTGFTGTLQYAAADTWSSLRTSFIWTSVAASITTILAGCLAWAARDSNAWKWAILATLALTLATPGPVAGMALILAYRDIPRVYDSAAMLVLAATLRSLPYALLLLWPFLRAFPQELLDAATLDGCSPLSRFLRVTLPLSTRPLIAAWAIAFAIGFGELPATNLVTPPGVPPITFVIWTLLHVGVESHLAGVALVMLGAVAVAAVAAASALWSLGSLSFAANP
jgi:iron(III) transport system permease protein